MQIIGISADDVETQKKFESNCELTITLLADSGKNISSLFGVLNQENGYPRRWTIIIDKNGTIWRIDRSVKAATHGKDLLETIGS